MFEALDCEFFFLNVETEKAAAEYCVCFRERVEREKAIALQREVERAAREKERRELEKRKKVSHAASTIPVLSCLD